LLRRALVLSLAGLLLITTAAAVRSADAKLDVPNDWFTLVVPRPVLDRPVVDAVGRDTTLAEALQRLILAVDGRTCIPLELTGPDDRNESGDKVIYVERSSPRRCSGHPGAEVLLFDGLGRQLEFETTVKSGVTEYVTDFVTKPPQLQTLGLLTGTVRIEGKGPWVDTGQPRTPQVVWHAPAGLAQPIFMTSPPAGWSQVYADGTFVKVLPAGEHFVGVSVSPDRLTGPHETIRVVRVRQEVLDVVRVQVPAGGIGVADVVVVARVVDEATARQTRSPSPIPQESRPVFPPVVGDGGLR
jgi:hypothetical protein